MKRIVFILLVLGTINSTKAQSQNDSLKKDTASHEIQTVFGNPGKLGWWIGPEFTWTKFDSRDVFIVGISGGIIVKHAFSVGLAGFGIVNSQDLKYKGINDTAAVYLYGGYGGLRLEYRFSPMKLINLTVPLLIGGGGVTYSTWGADDWNTNHEPTHDEAYVWDSYFVVEPGVMIGVNLFKFMRLDAGISYRYTSNIDLPKTDGDLLTGMNANFSLKFGRF